ncbi:MAG: response regulator [Deltaproteobacteria bacterium]|jgi:DNA-binding NtrC family response regulator|nr:response regulator [Deltaproteobacteria bacterium]
MKDKSKSILIVDDNRDLVTSLCDIFTEEGYDVKIAYDGLIIKSLLKDSSYDIALVDLVMKGKDGFEVLKEIRQEDPRISCFTMTGYANASNLESAKENGALHIFIKPFDIEKMLEIFAKELSKKKLSD